MKNNRDTIENENRNKLLLEAFDKGSGYSKLAKLFNVSRQRVYQIVNTRNSTKKFLDDLYKAIKQRDKFVCQWRNECSERESILGLIVHHIDKNPSNNDPSNLITLCKNCHIAFHGKDRSLNWVSPIHETLDDYRPGIFKIKETKKGKCKKCGSTKNKHKAFNLCFKCYHQDYMKKRRSL